MCLCAEGIYLQIFPYQVKKTEFMWPDWGFTQDTHISGKLRMFLLTKYPFGQKDACH